MSKLLQGRLPFVNANANVNGVTFNKAVRLLEISLDAFDPDATAQFTENKRDTLKFNAGDLIWNTTINALQVYDGDNWITLTSANLSLEAQGQVGSVQVVNEGAIVVSVGS
jgi:hypothetical protein|tara:strand:- start:2740 stop:3072 length:333 start_codon:yes stop_codon:yes gene_type:complete